MSSTEWLITFFITTTVYGYIPGPAMLYVAAQTLAHGRRSGLVASLGIHLGTYAHVVAAASGLSVLFHAVPTLYMAVKFAGAAYLIWLGILLFRAVPDREIRLPVVEQKSVRRAFFESITVEVLNPKTAIFFLAFLPQFIDPVGTLPVWMQFLLLGAIVNLIFSSSDVVCVLLADRVITRVQRSSHLQSLMRRVAGTMLVGLGIQLALEKK